MEHRCKKTDIKAVKKCELNREQTIKGLQEIVDNYSGSWKRFNVLDNALSLIKSQEQRIFDLEKRLRYLLQSKTIQDYDEVDIHTKEYVKDIHSLDANIEHLNEWNKELTEENERLSGAVKMYEEEREYHFEMSRKKNAETKADTVRKMHSEIEARCIKGGIYPAFVARTIDQIAKEMVGV